MEVSPSYILQDLNVCCFASNFLVIPTNFGMRRHSVLTIVSQTPRDLILLESVSMISMFWSHGGRTQFASPNYHGWLITRFKVTFSSQLQECCVEYWKQPDS